MKFFFTLALLGWAVTSFAQDPADIFHKTVDVDRVNAISFDIYNKDQVEYRTWPGDDLLIETSVEIKNVQQDILDFYMKQNRYVLEPQVSGDQMALVSYDKTRRTVKGTEGSAFEDVMIVVYMPEDFAATGDGRYTRTSR
ncbi:hypothetical protein CLV84_3810 [Neolewinella xylanilytica]|uniref:Uncharacterized protein n=1 Tax=Neolewinella xylanilytica TaxID=1514080 RepID=A0A2S6I100_9BACT|nr:hypothetical protein [Neolewinella xylanilytica]PPK84648.1 hypothetical protein CLV84_3810 [Neolewinella xylanilytica]